MPEDTTVVVPLPPGTAPETNNGGQGTTTMAATLDATVEKGLDQAYARTHEDWLATQQRGNAADAFLSEVTRLTFGAAASMQVQLAGGILAQRSAQSQPQQASGVAGSHPVGGSA